MTKEEIIFTDYSVETICMYIYNAILVITIGLCMYYISPWCCFMCMFGATRDKREKNDIE